MDDKKFIKENIVGRDDRHKKFIFYCLKIVLSAFLFAIIAAFTFAFFEPKFRKFMSEDEVAKVNLNKSELPLEDEKEEVDNPEGESPVSEIIAEESESLDVCDDKNNEIEDIVQSEIENYKNKVSSYDAVIYNMKQTAFAAESSIVEVRNRTRHRDFLGEELESKDSYAGIIIAKTENELIILTTDDAVNPADNIEISIKHGGSYPAIVKGVDKTDGFAVIAISVSALSEEETKSIKAVNCGNSKVLQKGDGIIAVGAPSGNVRSLDFGNVAYIASDYSYVDGNCDVLISDINTDVEKGSFIINQEGELIGMASNAFGDDGEKFTRVAGISDFIYNIETISNSGKIPYIGIRLREADIENYSGDRSGVFVRKCEVGSPAFEAGIQNGDIIRAIADNEIYSIDEYEKVMKGLRPGDEVPVKILRPCGESYKDLEFSVLIRNR